jgi:4,5-DOPA dioxygenase extradiol
VAQPAVFFGHGNPMNALQHNAFTAGWKELGASIAPPPDAILCVSAHWYLPGIAVTASASPRTIHDFGGFPRELYDVRYPAPGSPALAQRVAELLAPVPVAMDRGWGLDHGAWSVLLHAWPDAGIPVVQLSIDERREARWHYELASKLRPLRDEGVLVMGSGNLVHNLHAYSWGNQVLAPYDWARRFDTFAHQHIGARNFPPLVAYEELGRDAMLSAPTPDHYLPLLYVLAQHRNAEPISFPVEGFDGGSISMRCVRIG